MEAINLGFCQSVHYNGWTEILTQPQSAFIVDAIHSALAAEAIAEESQDALRI